MHRALSALRARMRAHMHVSISVQNGTENLLQQDREVFAKQGALQVEKARQEAVLAGKRTEQQEQQILELRAKLQTAEAELQVAHSDCVKTLRSSP